MTRGSKRLGTLTTLPLLQQVPTCGYVHSQLDATLCSERLTPKTLVPGSAPLTCTNPKDYRRGLTSSLFLRGEVRPGAIES